jgi:activator of HSP90 ATPase
MNTRTIRQTVTFKMSPDELYEVIMNSRKHAAFTESRVVMSRKVGGTFSAYDGEIAGKNVELVPGKRIVQTWRYSDWPDGHYSRCTFSLKEVQGGTRLTFTQSGVPEEVYEDIRQGWHDYYWEPIKQRFQK